MIRAANLLTLVCALSSVLGLAGCGGGDGSAVIGGTLSGLGSGLSLVVQDNDSSDLTLSANGNFEFASEVAASGDYDVTILTQPVGQSCQVANGDGSVDSAADPIDNIAITCVNSASVEGTVLGLTAGTSVTLDNGGTLLPIASNGSFAFPGLLAPGTSYDVTVSTQPVGETCTVTNGSGVIPASGVVTVTVACS